MQPSASRTEPEARKFETVPVDAGFLKRLAAGWLLALVVASMAYKTWVAPQMPVWVPATAWYLQALLATITHMAGHVYWKSPLLNWWTVAHLGHHTADYPPSKFLSAAYEPAKEDNSKAYYLSMVMTPLIVLALSADRSWATVAAAVVPGTLEMGLADVLHMAFHQEGHWLERFDWFIKLRTLHYYHHTRNMKTNYAIADFWLDGLMGVVQLSPVPM